METEEILNFIRKHGVTENSRPYLRNMMLAGNEED